MKTALSVLLLLCALRPAGAYDRNELAEYNDMYKNGNYQGALEGYQDMMAKEPANPCGFYNAGNAWFRMGRPGQAILYYSKAWRLNPRDPDIRANLEFALKHTGQLFVPEGVPRVLHYAYYCLSDDELRLGTIIFWWAFFLLLSFYYLKPGIADGNRTPLYVTGTFFSVLLLWFLARSASPFRDGAVIIDKSAQLMSGPGETFKAAAALPEARLVKLLDETDDTYYEIAIPREGIKGWVKKSAAGKI
jgi:tetratricopeptide (TPR) repeat protein